MSVLLFPVVVMLLASPADRAAFQLAPDLARAEHVFFGTVADLKADGVKATVLTPLKGALKKGEALEGRLQGDQFTRPAAPKGTVLVVAGDGRLEAFAANSFEAHYAAPTLALLGGSADLAPFKLKTTSRELASQLLHHVFGHEVIALGVREAALRELLARATPEWETDLMALPPALRLPSLSTAFVEYFTRFPRAAFTSAARWAVFSELASRDAVPYLAKELDELRVTTTSTSRATPSTRSLRLTRRRRGASSRRCSRKAGCGWGARRRTARRSSTCAPASPGLRARSRARRTGFAATCPSPPTLSHCGAWRCSAMTRRWCQRW